MLSRVGIHFKYSIDVLKYFFNSVLFSFYGLFIGFRQFSRAVERLKHNLYYTFTCYYGVMYIVLNVSIPNSFTKIHALVVPEWE